jgi:hypothetical protein
MEQFWECSGGGSPTSDEDQTNSSCRTCHLFAFREKHLEHSTRDKSTLSFLSGYVVVDFEKE